MLSNDVQVGTTILHQLGGSRFTLMTGCSNFAAVKNGLQFKVGRNANKITHCRVFLTDMDDYRIEYIYVPGSDISKMKTVLVQEGVTVETLQSSFTEATGLYTRLF